MPRFLSIVVTLLLALPLLAAPPAPDEISDPRITASEIRAHVKYLASEELQGRGSGTAGNDRAGDYLAARFKAAGLRPAGEGATYFQKFSVITGVRLGDDNSLTLQSGKQRTAFRAARDAAADPHAGAPAGQGDYLPLSYSKNGVVDAPVVFAGYGISKPDLDYDDYKGLDVRGKIVVVLRHTPDADDTGKFGPYAVLTYKVMTARAKGAAGIVLVTGPLNEGPENLGVFRLDSASADAGIPAVIVRRRVVEKLLAPTGKTLRDLQIMIAHGKTLSFAVPNSRFRMKVDVQRELRPTRNVIGLLEGSDPKLKDEVVVVGAHYDHLGLGGSHSLSASHQPAIHHGADDNASGTAGVLELAQHFAAQRSRIGRSILFMGFSGEEMGLLGSGHWTRKPTIPLERVAAMINLDMIGRVRNESCDVIGSASSPVWPDILAQANRELKLTLRTGGGSGFGGSDQQSFYAKKIPVLFFFTGSHPDYHKPSDTWEKVNVEGEAKLLHVVAGAIEGVSRVTPKPAFTASKEQEPAAGPGLRVYLGTIPDYAAEVEGVSLQGVREGSPAEKAGIRAGDVLVEFDGKSVRNVQEYTAILGGARAGVPVKVIVLRGGQRVTLTVTPGARR